MRNNKLKFETGFTLIELMVALGVFMVVMTITLSAFLNIIDIQKKTEAFRKVNDNLNFAMEAMMREIREGTGYCLPSACSSGIFSFTNKNLVAVRYELDGTGKYIKRIEGGVSLQMTSTDVNITSLSFLVKGIGTGDKQQPLVTISISGESGEKDKLKSNLNLQATVSQRKLDSGT